MVKKLRLALITIAAIFAVVLTGTHTVNAQTVTVSPRVTNYSINGSKKMYRYVESSGSYQNIFCYDYGDLLRTGFVYNVDSSIYTLSDARITEIFGSRANYNKALWILDNIFVDQGQTAEEKSVMIAQLKEALHSEVAINAVATQYNLPNFTAQDMDDAINYLDINQMYDAIYSVEQCALWNYTVNTHYYPGLSSLNAGFRLDGKYYMWMYTGLRAVADTKGDYVSPNVNNNIENTINSLSMSSNEAYVDAERMQIGPFIVNGYDNNITSVKSYEVKLNGITIPQSAYTASFDGDRKSVV